MAISIIPTNLIVLIYKVFIPCVVWWIDEHGVPDTQHAHVQYGDENSYGSSAAAYVAQRLQVEQPTAYANKWKRYGKFHLFIF